MTLFQHHDVVVIGAGIAGASIVSELLERGQTVCIVDSAPHPASACSSHAAAIAHPHVGRGAPRLLRLTRIAFLMAEARWGKSWNSHGIFQPSKKDKTFDCDAVASHLQSLDLGQDMAQAVCAKEAMRVCGIYQDGIWLPRGASLNLSRAAKDALKPHPKLTCCWHCLLYTSPSPRD
jgi:tRNA 5-methylaminomethyl-2-thiouridine biosynthesis bifunctional protein